MEGKIKRVHCIPNSLQIASRRSVLPATVFSAADFEMRAKTIRISGFVRAETAGVRLLAGMNAYMHLLAVFAAEFLQAILATEALCARVLQLVRSQVRLLREAFAAEPANERFVSGVEQQMGV